METEEVKEVEMLEAKLEEVELEKVDEMEELELEKVEVKLKVEETEIKFGDIEQFYIQFMIFLIPTENHVAWTL